MATVKPNGDANRLAFAGEACSMPGWIVLQVRTEHSLGVYMLRYHDCTTDHLAISQYFNHPMYSHNWYAQGCRQGFQTG